MVRKYLNKRRNLDVPDVVIQKSRQNVTGNEAVRKICSFQIRNDP